MGAAAWIGGPRWVALRCGTVQVFTQRIGDRSGGPPSGGMTSAQYMPGAGITDICVVMGTLADILSVLRRERARLFATYGLKSMAIFGSATRDDFRADSDVDIMVEFERPIGIEFVDLADELESIVQRRVDLVTRGAVKERMMPFIEPDLRYV